MDSRYVFSRLVHVFHSLDDQYFYVDRACLLNLVFTAEYLCIETE
jgi:hypothetical protein